MALIATAAAVSFTPAVSQATVCNQAASSDTHRGDLVPVGTPETSPAAHHKTDLGAMPGKGKGLERAAERSPALTQCAPPAPPTGGDGGGLFPGDISI